MGGEGEDAPPVTGVGDDGRPSGDVGAARPSGMFGAKAPETLWAGALDRSTPLILTGIAMLEPSRR
ncbi:hypothetical protein ABZU75_42830 [Streptosporangium sp. NPDC005286]|uniref:hypothetical protein n=1 Tax=Streptosporangium sp. NPDC005286 TaxID=3154463 RepID=UPI0033AC577A